jgi:hypothetical protein
MRDKIMSLLKERDETRNCLGQNYRRKLTMIYEQSLELWLNLERNSRYSHSMLALE